MTKTFSQSPTDNQSVAIVVGASGGIGQAMIQRFLADDAISLVIGITRSIQGIAQRNHERDANSKIDTQNHQRLSLLECDNQEESIEAIVQQLKAYSGAVRYVCICNGILHEPNYQPEKRIEELALGNLEQVFTANAFVPILWLKNLKPLLRSKHKVSVAVFSARVGSIQDNRLGGWYAYRSSKAALNMLLKTLSIEFARALKNVQLYAFHPGTTDTNLSKPFQARVAPEKLFTTNFVANQLYTLLSNKQEPAEIEFIDWEHKPIEW